MFAPLALGAAAERRLIDRLLRARAFTAMTAASLTELSRIEQRCLERLQRVGVVLQAASGAFYVDGPALADRFQQRRHQAAIAIFAVLLIALVIIFLTG